MIRWYVVLGCLPAVVMAAACDDTSPCALLEAECDECKTQTIADACNNLAASGDDCDAARPRYENCGGFCSEAIMFCKACEPDADGCEQRFDSAGSTYCEQALFTYERSCAFTP